MVNANLTINLEGNFTDDEINQKMFILGELVLNTIKENIRKMDLVDSGQLLQGWFSSYKNGVLTIENTQKYMIYLEYGTYAYWDQYGADNYPTNPDPKKKDLPPGLRKLFPKGMQPFAFIRKVLFNDMVMGGLIRQAFSS
jgi:hypothetical protein